MYSFSAPIKSLLLAIILMMSVLDSFGQRHYRTIASGNWDDFDTVWESSANGVTWIAATDKPVSSDLSILIRAGHNITSNTLRWVSNLTIDSGSSLVLDSDGLSFKSGSSVINGTIISNGRPITVEANVVINGLVNFIGGTLSSASLNITVNGTISNTNGILVNNRLIFTSTGRYQHRSTTSIGTIPLSTWQPGSTLEILGFTTATGGIANSTQTFSDIIWNCPNQVANTDGPSIGYAFNARNVTIISTGAGRMFLGNEFNSFPTGTSTITGNLVIQNGNVGMRRGTSNSVNTKIINLQGNLILGNGTLFSLNSYTSTINFSGTSLQQYSNTGVAISNLINFNVNANANVNFGTSVLGGTTGSFTMGNGATIATGHAQGFVATGANGAIQNNGARTFNLLANYSYNGTVAQQTGDGMPANVRGLIVSNTAGVSLPSGTATYTVSNSLTINPTASFLNLGQNILAGAYADSGTGRIVTQAASGALPSGRTWVLGVDFGSSSAQSIISANYRDLYTSNAGVKTAPAGTLNVLGNWSSAGGNVDLVTNNASLAFNGTAQSLTDAGSNGGAGLLFKNVSFSGGGVKTLASGVFSLKNDGILNVTGATQLNANGNLTLLSDASSTASIGQLSGGAQITGSVRANRFVTGGVADPYRTWRQFSSPVNVGGGYTLNQLIDDIIVSGAGGSANGFDDTPFNNASAFTYDNSGFAAITSINTLIPAGKGVYALFRGNRSNFTGKTVLPFADPESTVINYVGTLNQGTVSVALSSPGASSPTTLLGNPYASNISWQTLAANNAGVLANDFARIWNPAIRSYEVLSGSSSSSIISSGQGFFAVIGSGGTFNFTESIKVTNQPAALIMSAPEVSVETLDVSNTTLKVTGKVMVGNTSSLATTNPFIGIELSKPLSFNKDKSTVEFRSSASNNYLISEDLTYMAADGIKLSTLSADGILLAYNRLPSMTNGSVIKLNVDASVTGNYALTFNLQNIPSAYKIKLNDTYLSSSVEITQGQIFDISIDKTVASSYGAGRFSLTLVGPPETLPVEFSSFQGKKVNQGTTLTWETKSESNNDYFEIKRAGDDRVFKVLQNVPAKNTAATYSLIDSKPLTGNNYYQLNQFDKDGKTSTYKDLVSVYFDGVSTSNASFSIYPNPVIDKAIVKYDGSLEGKIQIKLFNTTGQVLLNKVVDATQVLSGYSLEVSNLTPGVYIVELSNTVSNTRLGTQKIIKQ